jgi:hypothetical protein
VGPKLVEVATCELIQFHKVVWFKFWGQIAIFWCWECVAPVCDAVLNCLAFCHGKGGEEVTFRVVKEKKGFQFDRYHVDRQWLSREGVWEVPSFGEVGASSE